MRNLRKLKERKQELENELSNYKWWGNEEDEEYQEEYGREYEHLDIELHNIRMQIFELNKNK
jgi:hypothetical protein